ncbi:MAG: GAK system ATP-grasp enzyme [Desulfobacterales bacterium]|nr:GAK system ATP-grasp enzyme [Desulfobacterales bacterium]
MPKIGVVGISGGWSSEKLVDTVSEMTGFRLLIDIKKLCLNLQTGEAFYESQDISNLDALIIKKIGSRYSPSLLDRLELLRYLNEKGLRIFSSPINILRVLDRLSCTVTLCTGNIPVPPTVITEDIACALNTVEIYGEAVFKPLYTSKAKGMVVIKNGKDAQITIEQFNQENKIMYIQKKINLNGKDLGVVFLGGKYITTYARSNESTSWNTTTLSGGKYIPYDPSDEIIELAYNAQKLFGLDFTCVDVAETKEGIYVFEVSAFGGFKGLETARRINAAKLYVEYVLKKIS